MLHVQFVEGSRSELLLDMTAPETTALGDLSRAPDLLFSVLQRGPAPEIAALAYTPRAIAASSQLASIARRLRNPLYPRAGNLQAVQS